MKLVNPIWMSIEWKGGFLGKEVVMGTCFGPPHLGREGFPEGVA